MLIIERDALGQGFRIKSKPACLKIDVQHVSEVAEVVNHYFRVQGCHAGCPLCQQIEDELRDPKD